MVTGRAEAAPRVMFTKDASSTPAFAALDIDSQSLTDKPRVLHVFATILNRIVASNEAISCANTAADSTAANCDGIVCESQASQLTVFDGLRAPGISIDKYFDRIVKYARCSPSCYVMAYIYIDRIMQRKDAMLITTLNVHRLLITGVLVAAKFLDDAYYNNAYYAKVGGISIEEMNRLELEFLFRLNFRLNVTESEFSSYCNVLHEQLLAEVSVSGEDETSSSRSYGFFLPQLLASTLSSSGRWSSSTSSSTCNSNNGDAGDSGSEIARGDSSRSNSTDGDSNCSFDSSSSDRSSTGIGASSTSTSPSSSSISPSIACPTTRQDRAPTHQRRTSLTASALSAASSILSFFSPRKPASSAASSATTPALSARPGSAPASVTSSRLVTSSHAVTVEPADSRPQNEAGVSVDSCEGSDSETAGSGGEWLRFGGLQASSQQTEARESNYQWWFGREPGSSGVESVPRVVLVSN
ncbi:hypothetical protein CLOM_g1440 [Closterium sp. NIES-68]|nr:hypothetical protein CLOM_g21974 [Closterium sp. NIES-68]GJP41795.1 hypothetical protein CLOM_g1440 [Closterium sp. NIES-68]